MASLQAHLLDLIVRVQFKRKMSGDTDLASVRRALQAGRLPVPRGVNFTRSIVGGVAGEWVSAKEPPTATLLYLHGGGYFACSAETHRPITAAYARLGFAVFVPDYRLAPEYSFPAALEDVTAVWQALLEQRRSTEVMVISGDSAGGGLSLSLMVSLRDKRAELPAAASLFSPWTDLAATGPSVTTNARRDAMFWAPGLASAGDFYRGQVPASHPLVSPLYADLSGLPPLLIHVGDREILRDDSVRLAERARAAGVHINLRVWPVVPHVWQLAQFVPEARQSLRLAGDFLKARGCLN